jgi:hypothetical protein
MGSPSHRGAEHNVPVFAERFIRSRIAGFKKDVRICLTPAEASGGKGDTHAYFPALGACCGTLEYLAGLYAGHLNGIEAQHIARWAALYLPQPDYDKDCIRILFDAFRHPVAHRGIASGVWIDRKNGPTKGNRLTWKVLADSRRPACRVVEKNGCLKRDPPWPCGYTHRVHIHLGALAIDIAEGAVRYSEAIASDAALKDNFMACMKQLYPD